MLRDCNFRYDFYATVAVVIDLRLMFVTNFCFNDFVSVPSKVLVLVVLSLNVHKKLDFGIS